MDTQSTRIISAARDVLKTYGYFVDNLWHTDDINFLCDQSSCPRLSLEEAMTVFDIANEQFDGEYGISWPQLEKALQAYMQRKESLQEMVPQEA
jgi:hypothetical protein